MVVDEEDNRLVQVDMLNQAIEDMVLGSPTATEEIVSVAVPPDSASYNKLCQSFGITPSRTQDDIFPPKYDQKAWTFLEKDYVFII